jgi:TolA-binding protein
MYRRKTLPYLVLLVVLFTSSITTCLAEEAVLYMARMNVCNLIESGNFSEAKSATDTLIADFSGNPGMPEALHWIAERYERFDKFEEANRIYQQIMQNYPDNPWAGKARMGISRVNIKSLIVSQDYEQAEESLDKYISDFASNPDLPEAIFWITERFQRLDRFAEAKKNYQRLIQNYSDSPWAGKARFWLSRLIILTLIESQDFDGAKAEFDKFVVNFPANPEFPEALYWIAERFERFGRFDEANLIYKQIYQNYSGSPWAEKSRIGVSRADVMNLVVSEKYDLAKEALEKLVADFSGYQRLPGTLYWIAERYERQGKFEEANRLYRRIMANYPDNSYADKSRFDIRETDIRILLEANEINEAEVLTDKFIADFKQAPYLPQALWFIAEKYYGIASRNEEQGNNEKAKEYYKKSVAVWEKITTQLPPSATYTPQTCYSIAYICFENTGEYEKALDYCERVIVNWPEYKYACDLQFLSGNYYERMVQAGLIPESEANPIIEDAYEALIEKYPNCDKAKQALVKLAEINFAKSQWAKAANYYELLLTKFPENLRPASILYSLGQSYDNIGDVNEAVRVYNEFLLKANTADPRIENVKQRLEQLTGSSKAKSILSDIMLSSIYGGSHCTIPFAGQCKSGDESGVCELPSCNWVGWCICNVPGNACSSDEPHIGNCHTETRNCPNSSMCDAPKCSINTEGKCVQSGSVGRSCNLGSYTECIYD